MTAQLTVHICMCCWDIDVLLRMQYCCTVHAACRTTCCTAALPRFYAAVLLCCCAAVLLCSASAAVHVAGMCDGAGLLLYIFCRCFAAQLTVSICSRSCAVVHVLLYMYMHCYVSCCADTLALWYLLECCGTLVLWCCGAVVTGDGRVTGPAAAYVHVPAGGERASTSRQFPLHQHVALCSFSLPIGASLNVES